MSGSKMIKLQSKALTSHFESFWSIVHCWIVSWYYESFQNSVWNVLDFCSQVYDTRILQGVTNSQILPAWYLDIPKIRYTTELPWTNCYIICWVHPKRGVKGGEMCQCTIKVLSNEFCVANKITVYEAVK